MGLLRWQASLARHRLSTGRLRNVWFRPATMMKKTQLLRFTGPVKRDPAIEAWMEKQSGALQPIARHWFEALRTCGRDVRELLHDGHPTACVDDAGFAYVNAFTSHVNVGFFRGAEIADPQGLLQGTGKFMRHVKLTPDGELDAPALMNLIRTAYADMQARVAAEAGQ